MKRSILFFVLFIFFLSSSAFASTAGVYVGAKAGASFMDFSDGNWQSSQNGDQTAQYDRSGDDTVFVFGAALGYEFDLPLRVELEYMYRTNFEHDKKPTTNGLFDSDTDLTTHTLMANLFYDFRNSSPFTPFVMGGIGVAVHQTDNHVTSLTSYVDDYEGSDVTRTEFAWNVGTGMAYDLTDNLTLDMLARYVDMGKAKWKNTNRTSNDKGSGSGNMSATEVLLGLRYKF
jgi:opacity protein-like surface antigen